MRDRKKAIQSCFVHFNYSRFRTNRPQIVGWALPKTFAVKRFKKLWALHTLLKIAVS